MLIRCPNRDPDRLRRTERTERTDDHALAQQRCEQRVDVAADFGVHEVGNSRPDRIEPVLAQERFALVLTSPMRRARATATLAGLGELAETDSDLREWNYGDYEGLTLNEIRAHAPEWNLFLDGAPHGESPDQVGARADRVIERVRAAHGDVALFAHGHLFRVLAARWLGYPASDGCHFLLDTATLNVLSYDHGVPAIKRWNAPLGPTAEEGLEDA